MNSHPCCASDPSVREELELKLQKELKDIPDEDNLDMISSILHALSHPIRLKIAFLLLKREHCVCELVKQTQKKPNLVSHHLMIMRNCGIVKRYIQSKWKFYKLNDTYAFILRGFNTK